uniref:Uncharacterized protein n=1 Tax=Arundo donax TaxID=35708 RepID=A0A0A9D5F0_ARUDO
MLCHLHGSWSFPWHQQAHYSVFPYHNVLRRYPVLYFLFQGLHLHSFLPVYWIRLQHVQNRQNQPIPPLDQQQQEQLHLQLGQASSPPHSAHLQLPLAPPPGHRLLRSPPPRPPLPRLRALLQ